MTNPAGVSFISYRRVRLAEAELLVQAQHDHGIPTWQDVTNLAHNLTEDELQRVLADPSIANALLWVTPEVADSPIIRTIEVPAIKSRADAKDGFFVVPVAAGGLGYGAAADLISGGLGLDDFSQWNFEKTNEDPISSLEAARLARHVLRYRLSALHAALDPDEPLRIGIWNMSPAPTTSDDALRLDWQRHFDGRFASAEIWAEALVPALRAVSDEVRAQAASRAVVAHGSPSLTAALALGTVFIQPRGIHLTWMQASRNKPDSEPWSLTIPAEESQLMAREVPSSTSASDILVAVNINASTERSIKLTQQDGAMPTFRGAVILEAPERQPLLLDSPGQVVHAVEKTVAAIKAAQARWPVDSGKLHLVLAAPVGFAALLGQRLNTLGPVQTYEHDQVDLTGRYVPGPVLWPN